MASGDQPDTPAQATDDSGAKAAAADPHRAIVDAVDVAAVVPSVRMLAACRMALQPGRMALALAAVVLVYLAGSAMDAAWGPITDRGAVESFLTGREVGGEPMGVFAALVEAEVSAFKHTIGSALRLELGVPLLTAPGEGSRSGVLGGLTRMVLGVPAWLVSEHPGFAAVFASIGLVVTVTVGGAIARSTAVQVGRHRRIGAGASVAYVGRRMVWYLATALIAPGVAVALLGLAAGLGALLNVPGLDVVGGLAFGLVVLLAAGAVVVLIGMAAAGNLMMPALAVEGTDAFDAVSRSYAYVFGRPLHFLWYTAVLLVAGALAYAALGLAVYGTMWLARGAAGVLVFRGDEAGWYEAVAPPPRRDRLLLPVDWEGLSATSRLTATMIRQWQLLLLALLPAYAFSYYFTAYTWVYLLIRRSADGAPIAEVYDGELAGDGETAGAGG
ncbi:MAG: hypothetical protein AAF823_07480 [Planctomycetota bacterium]